LRLPGVAGACYYAPPGMLRGTLRRALVRLPGCRRSHSSANEARKQYDGALIAALRAVSR